MTGTAAESAAKKAKKAFAAYDEINVLSTSDSSGSTAGGGGGGSGGGYLDNAFSVDTPIMSGFDTTDMENQIASIAGTVGLAKLVLGAILTFSGANIPLGIALMALGAVDLATALALNWNSMEEHVSGTFDAIMGIMSFAAFAIGAILVASAVNIPLGVALMAVGAAGLATVVALNWNSTTNNTKNVIKAILAIVSGALLVIGIIMIATGAFVPLGIALLAAGAAGIVTSIALDWKDSEGKISSVVSTIGTIVGSALLVLGALLALSGVAVPLGIALLCAGAVTLVASIAPKWDGLSEKTKSIISIIAASVGAALLVLGVILLLTGAGIPLGLGLIAAGAASLATAIAPNWNWLVEKVTGICEKVKTAFQNLWAKIKEIFSPVGQFFSHLWDTIKEKFTNIGTKIGDAISGAFKKAVNSVFATIENTVNTPIRAINSLIGVINKVPGINLGRLSTFSLPRLAQGGYLAANNPRLAIVGDNTREGEIVTPESKIREQVKKALEEMKGAVQTVKLELELLIRYPDGRTIIKTINQAQLEAGKILLEV